MIYGDDRDDALRDAREDALREAHYRYVRHYACAGGGLCPTCNGSGEGLHDGSACPDCGGEGEFEDSDEDTQ